MASIEFREVAELINCTRSTTIDLSNPQRDEGGWTFYKGETRVHLHRASYGVLALHADCTKDAMDRAFRQVFVPKETQVVYAASLGNRLKYHHELFKEAAGRWDLRSYLASFIREELEGYLGKIRGLVAADFIEPDVNLSEQLGGSSDESPLYQFMAGPRADTDAGSLAVVLADPGQGKTYLSRNLVGRLAGKQRSGVPGFVPILIEAAQWTTLTQHELEDLTRTITHSFEFFGAPIPWITGHEDRFLHVALKADLIRIVFDGLDEYLLHTSSTHQPLDVIDALLDLARTDGARVMVTSRSTYWRANVEQAGVGLANRSGVILAEIRPFDSRQAYRYFAQRLPILKQVSHATSVHSTLLKQSGELAGRGFVLSLIADLVSREGHSHVAPRPDQEALPWLLEAMCEREQERQKLVLTAADQLSILRQFARECALKQYPDTSLLDIMIAIERPDLQIAERETCIARLQSHPLIELTSSTSTWKFRQEQVEVYFIALAITESTGVELQKFVARMKLSPSRRQDVAARIVETLSRRGESDGIVAVSALLAAITAAEGPRAALGMTGEGRRLAGTIALAALDRTTPGVATKAERGSRLRSLFGGSVIRGVTFEGAMSKLDMRGTTFEACVFEDIAWSHCQFDGGTTFQGCAISGGVSPQYCTGFGELDLSDCELDAEARNWINDIQVSEGATAYTSEHLKRDIGHLLVKFVNRAGIGLKTISVSDLRRGPIASSPKRDAVADAFIHRILQHHHLSGRPDGGYNVSPTAVDAMKFWANNNVLTGPLASLYEELRMKFRV